MSDPKNPLNTPLSPERRAALERLGRYAAYTPPLLLTLLTSSRAVAASPTGGAGELEPPDPGGSG